MIYKVEDSLRNFEPWSGAKYTFEKLSDEELDTLDSMLEDIFDYSSVETMPTATDINDLLWFENDTIAQWLGYEDWEDLERIKAGDEDLEESLKSLKKESVSKKSTDKRPLKEAVSYGNWSEDEIKKLLDALDSFSGDAWHLAEVFEILSDPSRDINDLIVNGYPFDKSFDELAWNIDNWVAEIQDAVEELKNK